MDNLKNALLKCHKQRVHYYNKTLKEGKNHHIPCLTSYLQESIKDYFSDYIGDIFSMRGIAGDHHFIVNKDLSLQIIIDGRRQRNKYLSLNRPEQFIEQILKGDIKQERKRA